MQTRALAVLCLLLVGALAPWAPARAEQPPPTGAGAAPLRDDPAIVRGRLDNGVSYAVLRHPTPPGQVVLKLHARAGSLHEEDGRPGASFTTARLLYLAGASTPAGRAVQRLGEALPHAVRPLEVQTEFDGATFTVTLPLAEEKAVSIGLRYLRDAASGEGLTDDSVTARRPDLLRERAAHWNLSERLVRAVLPALAPGSRLAEHPVVPGVDDLCALEGADLRRFHAHRYAPERLTLIAVGDARPEMLVDLIAREFGGLRPLVAQGAPWAAPPQPLPAPPAARAVIADDEEMVQGIVEVLAIEADSGATLHESQWVERQIDRIAAEVMQARLRGLLDAPGTRVRGTGAWIGSAPGGKHVTLASVTGDAADWRRLTADLMTQVEAARTRPPEEEEVRAAAARVIGDLERQARRRNAATSGAVADRLERAVARGDALLSPEDEAALARRTLAAVDPDRIAGALAERLSPDRAALVLLLPRRADNPTPEEAEAALALAVPGEPCGPARAVRATVADLAAPESPTGGGVEEISVHPSSGAVSAWLSSGVRLHHREMRAQPGRVHLSVVLKGGRAEEDARTRGLTIASASLWRDPASRSTPSEELRRLAANAQIEVQPTVRADAVVLDLAFPTPSLERALRMVRLMLTEPAVEPEALERWRWNTLRRFEAGRVQPLSAADDALMSVIAPRDDPARAPLTEEEARAVTIDAAGRWIEALVARAPIEAAIVGDVPRGHALDLAARYLGSIPQRARIRPAPHPADRHATPEGPFGATRLRIATPAPTAVVLVGLRGAAADDHPSARALDLAARILAARIAELRAGERRLASTHGVQHLSADDGAGAGLFYAVATCDPAGAEPLAEAIERAIGALASEGPTEEELIIARAMLLDEHNRLMNDPAHWAGALASSTLRARTLDDIMSEGGRIASTGAPAVREALALHDPPTCCRAPRLRIIVTPDDQPRGR